MGQAELDEGNDRNSEPCEALFKGKIYVSASMVKSVHALWMNDLESGSGVGCVKISHIEYTHTYLQRCSRKQSHILHYTFVIHIAVFKERPEVIENLTARRLLHIISSE